MKKTFLIFGISIFCIILIGLVSLVVVLKNGAHYDVESKAAGTKILETVGADWEPEAVFKVSVPEMKSDGKLKENTELVTKFLQTKLGKMVRHDSLKGEANIGFYNGKKSITAKYVTKIQCEKDSGEIILGLEFTGDQWLLRSYHVNSYGFFK